MTILTTAAEIIGFVVLFVVALLAIITAAVTAHDAVRARFPKYDLWLYDDVARWNRRCRRQNGEQETHSGAHQPL